MSRFVPLLVQTVEFFPDWYHISITAQAEKRVRRTALVQWLAAAGDSVQNRPKSRLATVVSIASLRHCGSSRVFQIHPSHRPVFGISDLRSATCTLFGARSRCPGATVQPLCNPKRCLSGLPLAVPPDFSEVSDSQGLDFRAARMRRQGSVPRLKGAPHQFRRTRPSNDHDSSVITFHQSLRIRL